MDQPTPQQIAQWLSLQHQSKLALRKHILAKGKYGSTEEVRALIHHDPEFRDYGSKNVRIDLRVSKLEKIAVQRLASESGMTVTNYLITSALKQKITISPTKLTDKFNKELSSIGNNINQLVHRAHRYAGITRVDAQVLKDILQALKSLNSKIQ